MNLKCTKSLVVSLASLAIFFCPSLTYAGIAEKESVLRACTQLFGAPVDTKPHLFEVNQFYVLRVKFDSGARLEQLALEPKYYFEESHPEWKYPDNFTYLSQVEYDKLLTQVDTIKPKGVLIKPHAGGGVVTNMTLWHKAIYKNAVLEWGEVVDLRRGENAPLAINWIRLNYQKSASHKPRVISESRITIRRNLKRAIPNLIAEMSNEASRCSEKLNDRGAPDNGKQRT